jgi:hypothetical protein
MKEKNEVGIYYHLTNIGMTIKFCVDLISYIRQDYILLQIETDGSHSSKCRFNPIRN